MDRKIENIPSARIVFMRRKGSYGAENIKLMEQFKDWVKAKDLWNVQTVILGIAQDNPAFVQQDECRYDTCLLISEEQFIDDNKILSDEISGGIYAVFKIQHTQEAVQRAWVEIFPELSRCGYIMDERRPILERYRNKLVQEHQCEICVPIQPLNVDL